jgi:hypothetical protein
MMAKVNALRKRWLSSPECSSLAPPARAGVRGVSKPQPASGEDLSHRDAAQSALMPSVLDRAFKGEL